MSLNPNTSTHPFYYHNPHLRSSLLNLTMVGLVQSILLSLSVFQLAYAADGTVTFYRDIDCKGTNMWEGHVGSGTGNRDTVENLDEALSFSYSGYFNLNIAAGSEFNAKTCSYCSNNHEDHHDGGCVNVCHDIPPVTEVDLDANNRRND